MGQLKAQLDASKAESEALKEETPGAVAEGRDHDFLGQPNPNPNPNPTPRMKGQGAAA